MANRGHYNECKVTFALQGNTSPMSSLEFRKILWSPVINNATVEHGANNDKVMGLINRDCKIYTIYAMQVALMWINVSVKCNSYQKHGLLATPS